MPTEAVTGTKQMRTAAKSDKAESKPKSEKKSGKTVGAPLADESGNGTIQVVAPDGRIVNVNAGVDGWEDEVREFDPKHPALKNG